MPIQEEVSEQSGVGTRRSLLFPGLGHPALPPAGRRLSLQSRKNRDCRSDPDQLQSWGLLVIPLTHSRCMLDPSGKKNRPGIPGHLRRKAATQTQNQVQEST